MRAQQTMHSPDKCFRKCSQPKAIDEKQSGIYIIFLPKL